MDSAYNYIGALFSFNCPRFYNVDVKTECKIEFKIGAKGSPEDIHLTGFNNEQSRFLKYLIGKFNNLKMPGTETVAIETYYTYHVFTISLRQREFGSKYERLYYMVSQFPKEKLLSTFSHEEKLKPLLKAGFYLR